VIQWAERREQCPLYRFRIVGPESIVKQFLLESPDFGDLWRTAITIGMEGRAQVAFTAVPAQPSGSRESGCTSRGSSEWVPGQKRGEPFGSPLKCPFRQPFELLDGYETFADAGATA
jgi:hypothetical protein